MRSLDPRQVLNKPIELLKKSLGEMLLLLKLYPEEKGVNRLHNSYDLIDEVLK